MQEANNLFSTAPMSCFSVWRCNWWWFHSLLLMSHHRKKDHSYETYDHSSGYFLHGKIKDTEIKSNIYLYITNTEKTTNTKWSRDNLGTLVERFHHSNDAWIANFGLESWCGPQRTEDQPWRNWKVSLPSGESQSHNHKAKPKQLEMPTR